MELLEPTPWQTVLNKREEVKRLLQEHGYILYSQTLPHFDNVALRLYIVLRHDKDISDVVALLFQNNMTLGIISCNYYYNLIEVDVCMTDNISFVLRPTRNQISTSAFETYKNDLMPFADSYADFLSSKVVAIINKDIEVVGKSIFETKYDVYTDPRTTIVYVEFTGTYEILTQAIKASAATGFNILSVEEKPLSFIIGVDIKSPFFQENHLTSKQQMCERQLKTSLKECTDDLLKKAPVECTEIGELSIFFKAKKQDFNNAIKTLISMNYTICGGTRFNEYNNNCIVIVSCNSPAFCEICEQEEDKEKETK